MVQLDADGQHRPEFILKLLSKALVENADIVIGSSFLTVRKDHSLRMFGSRMITVLIKLLTGHRISDPISGLRLYGRTVLEQYCFDNSLNPGPESIALFLKRGYVVSELQVEMRERPGGNSYLNPFRSIQYMVRVLSTLLFVH